MRKRSYSIEWHIVEDDVEWEYLTTQPPDTVPTTNRRQRQQRILWFGVILLLLVANIDRKIWSTAQTTFHHLAADVPTKTQQEFRTVARDSTLTVEDRWGPEYRLETHFFIYHFRQHDATAIRAGVSQIDTIHNTLRRNFGLGILPSTEKLVIDVSMTQPPGGNVLPWQDAPGHFRVPSTAVYTTSLGLTDVQLLVQSITLQQIDYLLAQASEQYQIKLAWHPILNGLRLWQVWDTDLPLAIWKKEVVQWLYVDLPAIDPEQPLMLPDRYSELCAVHKLWMSSPLQLSIPFGCTSLDQKALFFPVWDPRNPLTHLDQLTLLMPFEEYMTGPSSLYSTHRPGQTVALATLIEYAIATYGRERLPQLMVGLSQYETWDTLLPAVFGVSTREFEEGWQIYLETHYGASITFGIDESTCCNL